MVAFLFLLMCERTLFFRLNNFHVELAIRDDHAPHCAVLARDAGPVFGLVYGVCQFIRDPTAVANDQRAVCGITFALQCELYHFDPYAGHFIALLRAII